MDVRALIQGNGGVSGLVSALPSVPADSRAVLNEVASSTGLSDSERTQLAQAVATVDSGVSNASLRSEVLAHVSGLGVYLKNTSDEGWPRWNVLTALRVYGLNLDASVQATPVAQTQAAAVQPAEQVVARQVIAKLDNVARSSRGVSLEHVAAVVKVATPAPAKANTPVSTGHKVEVVA